MGTTQGYLKQFNFFERALQFQVGDKQLHRSQLKLGSRYLLQQGQNTGGIAAGIIIAILFLIALAYLLVPTIYTIKRAAIQQKIDVSNMQIVIPLFVGVNKALLSLVFPRIGRGKTGDDVISRSRSRNARQNSQNLNVYSQQNLSTTSLTQIEPQNALKQRALQVALAFQPITNLSNPTWRSIMPLKIPDQHQDAAVPTQIILESQKKYRVFFSIIQINSQSRIDVRNIELQDSNSFQNSRLHLIQGIQTQSGINAEAFNSNHNGRLSDDVCQKSQYKVYPIQQGNGMFVGYFDYDTYNSHNGTGTNWLKAPDCKINQQIQFQFHISEKRYGRQKSPRSQYEYCRYSQITQQNNVESLSKFIFPLQISYLEADQSLFPHRIFTLGQPRHGKIQRRVRQLSFANLGLVKYYSLDTMLMQRDNEASYKSSKQSLNSLKNENKQRDLELGQISNTGNFIYQSQDLYDNQVIPQSQKYIQSNHSCNSQNPTFAYQEDVAQKQAENLSRLNSGAIDIQKMRQDIQNHQFSPFTLLARQQPDSHANQKSNVPVNKQSSLQLSPNQSKNIHNLESQYLAPYLDSQPQQSKSRSLVQLIASKSQFVNQLFQKQGSAHSISDKDSQQRYQNRGNFGFISRKFSGSEKRHGSSRNLESPPLVYNQQFLYDNASQGNLKIGRQMEDRGVQANSFSRRNQFNSTPGSNYPLVQTYQSQRSQSEITEKAIETYLENLHSKESATEGRNLSHISGPQPSNLSHTQFSNYNPNSVINTGTYNHNQGTYDQATYAEQGTLKTNTYNDTPQLNQNSNIQQKPTYSDPGDHTLQNAFKTKPNYSRSHADPDIENLEDPQKGFKIRLDQVNLQELNNFEYDKVNQVDGNHIQNNFQLASRANSKKLNSYSKASRQNSQQLQTIATKPKKGQINYRNDKLNTVGATVGGKVGQVNSRKLHTQKPKLKTQQDCELPKDDQFSKKINEFLKSIPINTEQYEDAYGEEQQYREVDTSDKSNHTNNSQEQLKQNLTNFILSSHHSEIYGRATSVPAQGLDVGKQQKVDNPESEKVVNTKDVSGDQSIRGQDKMQRGHSNQITQYKAIDTSNNQTQFRSIDASNNQINSEMQKIQKAAIYSAINGLNSQSYSNVGSLKQGLDTQKQRLDSINLPAAALMKNDLFSGQSFENYMHKVGNQIAQIKQEEVKLDILDEKLNTSNSYTTDVDKTNLSGHQATLLSSRRSHNNSFINIASHSTKPQDKNEHKSGITNYIQSPKNPQNITNEGSTNMQDTVMPQEIPNPLDRVTHKDLIQFPKSYESGNDYQRSTNQLTDQIRQDRLANQSSHKLCHEIDEKQESEDVKFPKSKVVLGDVASLQVPHEAYNVPINPESQDPDLLEMQDNFNSSPKFRTLTFDTRSLTQTTTSPIKQQPNQFIHGNQQLQQSFQFDNSSSDLLGTPTLPLSTAMTQNKHPQQGIQQIQDLHHGLHQGLYDETYSFAQNSQDVPNQNVRSRQNNSQQESQNHSNSKNPNVNSFSFNQAKPAQQDSFGQIQNMNGMMTKGQVKDQTQDDDQAMVLEDLEGMESQAQSKLISQTYSDVSNGNSVKGGIHQVYKNLVLQKTAEAAKLGKKRSQGKIDLQMQASNLDQLDQFSAEGASRQLQSRTNSNAQTLNDSQMYIDMAQQLKGRTLTQGEYEDMVKNRSFIGRLKGLHKSKSINGSNVGSQVYSETIAESQEPRGFVVDIELENESQISQSRHLNNLKNHHGMFSNYNRFASNRHNQAYNQKKPGYKKLQTTLGYPFTQAHVNRVKFSDDQQKLDTGYNSVTYNMKENSICQSVSSSKRSDFKRPTGKLIIRNTGRSSPESSFKDRDVYLKFD